MPFLSPPSPPEGQEHLPEKEDSHVAAGPGRERTSIKGSRHPAPLGRPAEDSPSRAG